MNPKNKIDVLIIYLKLAVLTYCTFLYVDSSDFLSTIKSGVLLMLIYISLSILQCIFKESKLRIIFEISSLADVILCGIFLSEYFILLLPVNVIDMIDIYIEKSWSDVIILVFLFIIGMKAHYMFAICFFVSIVSVIYFKTIYYSFSRIIMLTEEKDDLKQKNYRLENSIQAENGFEEQIMYTSKLEERNKISQEMHDKLGHSVSASILQLEASKMLVGKDNERACSMIQNSIKNLSEGMNDIRNTLKNIKPASNELGINKVKLLLKKFESSSDIAVNLMYKGDLEKIDYRMWNIMCENINESLTNVLKYSKANKVSVDIEVLNKVVKCAVNDNGIGTVNIVKGLGICGMEERTQNVGGKVIIDGGNGFSVITLLPV